MAESKFPITTARQELGITPTTAVRADIDVRTGEEAVGAAAGQAVIEGIKLGIRFDIMEGKAQADIAERDARLSMVQLLSDIRQEDDVSKWDATFQAHTERVTNLTPKNQRGARQYNSVINNLIPIWQERFVGLKEAKLEDNMIAASIVKVSNLLDSATIDNMALVATKIKTELEVRDRLSPSVSRTDTVKAKATVEHDIELSIAKKMALSNPEGTLAKIKGDKMQGFAALMPDDILRIRNMANSTITQAKIEIQRKDNEISEGFLNLLINKLEPNKPQLTFDMIVASDLSVDAKEKWFGKLRVFDNYSEGELKEAFTDKGEVLAEIYDKIDKGTLTDELDTMVGKGLSPTTAERIKKEIRLPFEAKTEQLFKRIFGWTPELGFKDDFAGFLYEKSLREWQAEIKEQKATGEKIIEIGRSIVRPHFLEHLQRTMASDEDITRMMELALGEETQKLDTPKPIETEEPKRESGEPLTPADFTSEVSRLKGIDRVKAKEYYDTWIGKFEKTEEVEEPEE